MLQRAEFRKANHARSKAGARGTAVSEKKCQQRSLCSWKAIEKNKHRKNRVLFFICYVASLLFIPPLDPPSPPEETAMTRIWQSAPVALAAPAKTTNPPPLKACTGVLSPVPLSACELPELAKALYNALPRRDVRERRFLYLDVVRGDAVCAFVRSFYADKFHRTLTARESATIGRHLVKSGVFVVVDAERERRPNGFGDDSSCLARFRPAAVAAAKRRD